MMQLVVYVLLLVYQTPSGPTFGVRQYIGVFQTEATCQAKAHAYQPSENDREAAMVKMLQAPHNPNDPKEQEVDASLKEAAAPRIYACQIEVVTP